MELPKDMISLPKLNLGRDPKEEDDPKSHGLRLFDQSHSCFIRTNSKDRDSNVLCIKINCRLH